MYFPVYARSKVNNAAIMSTIWQGTDVSLYRKALMSLSTELVVPDSESLVKTIKGQVVTNLGLFLFFISKINFIWIRLQNLIMSMWIIIMLIIMAYML